MTLSQPPNLTSLLARIAEALERMSPPPPPQPDFAAADAFVWRAEARTLAPVNKVSRVDLALLRGVDFLRDQLLGNTERFSRGLSANNVLLWGARGMGKSSLVKAAHAEVNARLAGTPRFSGLKLVEIHREDIELLPELMGLLRDARHPLHRLL